MPAMGLILNAYLVHNRLDFLLCVPLSATDAKILNILIP